MAAHGVSSPPSHSGRSTPQSSFSEPITSHLLTRVKTAVRIRPPSKNESETASMSVINYNQTTNSIEVSLASASQLSKNIPINRYTFDHMFPETATQEDVYKNIGRPLIHCVLNGINCSLFGYGIEFAAIFLTLLIFCICDI
jgi:hypothetical protein